MAFAAILSLSGCEKEKVAENLCGRWKYSNAGSGYTARFYVEEEGEGAGVNSTLLLMSPVETLFDRKGILSYDSVTGKGKVVFTGEPAAFATVASKTNGRRVDIVLFNDGKQIFTGSFNRTYIW